jgi:tetratricopeptide (TPR) repeat protein
VTFEIVVISSSPKKQQHNMESLPIEILSHIFIYLNKQSFLKVRLLCQRLSQATDSLWMIVYQQTWHVPHRLLTTTTTNTSSMNLLSITTPPPSLPPSQNWKDLFFERYKMLHLNQEEISTNTNISTTRKMLHFRSSGSQKHKDHEHYTDKGYGKIYRNDYLKAVKCFEKSIRILPSARAYEGLARIYQQYTSPSHVIVFSEAALRLSPVNPGELYYLRGKALLSMNRTQHAHNDLSKAIEYLSVSPVNYHLFLKTSEVYYDRMITNLQLENYDQAYYDCDTITRTEKSYESGECFLRCATILFEQKQANDQSLRFLRRVKHKNIDYYLLLMQLQCTMGNYEESLHSYQSYLEFIANNQQQSQQQQLDKKILLQMGICLLMNGMIDESIEKFKQGASVAISSLVSQLVKQAALRQMKEFNTILNKQSFIHIDMAHSLYYYMLGLFYLYNNVDFNCASSNFNQCITMNPTLAEAYYYRSLTHSNQVIQSFMDSSNMSMIQKVLLMNRMREALNDVNSAFTLISHADDNQQQQQQQQHDIHLLKAYILYFFQKVSESLKECDIAIKMNNCTRASTLRTKISSELQSRDLPSVMDVHKQLQWIDNNSIFLQDLLVQIIMRRSYGI